MKAIAIVATLLVFGCSSEDDKKCERYADMEVKCGDFPADQNKMTHKMATGFCIEALGGNDMLNLKPEIECAQKSKECSVYETCQAGTDGP